MKIEMLSCTVVSGEVRNPGEFVEVDEQMRNLLVHMGSARDVQPEAPAAEAEGPVDPEAAAMEPPESATLPKPRKRRFGR